MATDATASKATEPLNSTQKKQQQAIPQSQWQPIQSINSTVHHQQATDKHRLQEHGEEWLGQWSHIWTKRQSPEWKPRRASVATCQQQQYLLQQHQHRKHRMRSYDNNQSTLNYHQQQQHHQQHTLTDSSLRKYILQRLQRPLKAGHANGETVKLCEVDSFKQQESGNSQMLSSDAEAVGKEEEANKREKSFGRRKERQEEQLERVIEVKSDQVPQCRDEANSDANANAVDCANCGKVELEKSRYSMVEQQKQNRQTRQQSEIGEGIIQCSGARQATTTLSDGRHLIGTGQETGDAESRALNLETLCTSSSGVTDCCCLEEIVGSASNEMPKRKRKRRRTRIILRGALAETGGNKVKNTTNTNSCSDTETDTETDTDSNSNSCSLEPNTDTECEEEDCRLLQLPTGSFTKQQDEPEESELKLNRSCSEQKRENERHLQQQQEHSYLLPEPLDRDKSTLATCCFSQTTPSPASRSTNEPCKVTEKPTISANHGIIQELELQEKQRKSLIFSMALKELISDSKLVSECYSCRCSWKNSNSNNSCASSSSVYTPSSSSTTSCSRSRRTGNNKVNLGRAATCEQSQDKQLRSVSSSVLEDPLLVSSVGKLETLVSCSNEAESEEQASLDVERERDRRSSEDTYIRIGFNDTGKSGQQQQQQQQQQPARQQLTICARCYHRQKSSDNFGAENITTTLKQHQPYTSKRMTRSMKQDITNITANNNNINHNNNLNINDQQDSSIQNQQQRQQQQQSSLMLSQSNGSYCPSPRKSTTSIELINEDDDCDLESLIVESWLDDHPNFVHDYFMRKANHQLIDDWLITHAKVSNTSLKSSQLDSMVNLRSSESRLSQNSLSSNHNHGIQNTPTVGFRSGSESPTTSGPQMLTGLYKLTNSPAFLTSTRPDGQQSGGGGSATPVRKISATDFESRTGNNYLRPMVSTTPDGKPTFLSQLTFNDDNEGLNSSKVKNGALATTPLRQNSDEVSKLIYKSENNNKLNSFNLTLPSGDNVTVINENENENENENGKNSVVKVTTKPTQSPDSEDDDNEVTRNDEVKLIFELVKNICNDLEIKTLLHKILKNIAVLINADKSSLFLVCGKAGDPNRHLVSQLFNVDQDDSELVSGQCELKDNECIRIPWGTGLVGYVAESGESLNIENCYDDPRFTNTVDQRTGYVTKHMLCAPIFDKRNEIVGVAQVINKRDGKSFSKSDEKKFKRYLQFCGIGLRNAQSYEQSQLENKRNQVLLDLARMVFEEQSTIEQVVYRIMLHTQSLLECQRCQVLLIDDGSDDLDQLLQLPNNTLGSSSTWSWLGNQARQQQSQRVACNQQSQLKSNQNVTIQQQQSRQTAYQFQSKSRPQSQSQFQESPEAVLATKSVAVQGTPDWRPHCGRAADLMATTSVSRNPGQRKEEKEEQVNTDLSPSPEPTSAPKAQISSLESTYKLEGEESEVIAQTQPQNALAQNQLSSANNVGIHRQNETFTSSKQTNTNLPPTKHFSLVFDLECDGNDLVMHSNKSEKSTMAPATTATTNSSSSSDTSTSNFSSSSPTTTTTANLNPPPSTTTSKKTRQFPINFGITGYVAMTGETLNIENAHEHERFDPSVDEGSNFKHKSILCMPIRNGQRKIIGVSQLINKKNGKPFNKNDEDLFEAFAIFCGLGIHNTLMYEKVLKIMAKQRVTFEVLSYHATAPLEEAKKLYLEQIPSCFALNLTSLKFNDFSLDEQFMLKSCLRFFLDLDLMRRFQIDQLVFCNWILSVQKNYRKVTYHPIVGGTGLKAAPVRYHNWRHAFNVSQMMFAILINTQICQALGELETLALLIACLCHDLDHRGTNNSFQIKSASPLAELYSTSTMEHHHFDQCVMILNSQGNQILANLSPQEYSRVIVLLEEAILATDLANYFQKREIFFQLVNSDTFDWQNNLEHRSLLRCMLMTACDVAAITKPWSVQKVVADLVMSEFYQQGDIEKQELNIEPIDMMNRDKMSKLPEMQIGFIDSICAPIYAAFAKLFPRQLSSLLEGCLTNRNLWAEVAKNNNNNVTDLPNSNTNTDSNTTSKIALDLATNLQPLNQIEQLDTKEQTIQSSIRHKRCQSLCTVIYDQTNMNREYPLSGLINKRSPSHRIQSTNVDCQRKSV